MAFKKFIYSTTAAALNKAITAKTVTNDDIAFVNENGVMFIQTQGVKFPCGYSKAEADGRYLKLTGGTLTGTLVLDETNTSNAINFVQNGQYYGYITSSNMYFGAGNDYF